MNANDHSVLTDIIKTVAYALIIYAQYRIIRRVAERKMKAVVLSWFGWGILLGISYVAQWQALDYTWSWNLFSLLLSVIGSFLIGSTGLLRNSYAREKGDVLCLVGGVACTGIHFLFTDPWITTVLAITADVLVAIPIFQSAFKDPTGQRSDAWPISLFAWALTGAAILFHFSWLHLLWPIYFVLFNAAMTYLTYFRNGAGVVRG